MDLQRHQLHPLAGRQAAFYTLGCRLNYSETSTIARELAQVGVRRIDEEHHHDPTCVPDICIINTCSVTDTADKKCRSLINRLIREYPKAIIVVTGCYAQIHGERIAEIPGVDIIVGSGRKREITDLLLKYYQEQKVSKKVYRTLRRDLHHFEHGVSSDDRTRHFLKVQDGCNNFCTFCTIPMARGFSRNGSISSIIEQVKGVAAHGGLEVVLTGVNIGDFGRSTGETFIELLHALSEVTSIVRYRIGSIEPDLLTPEIISFVAEHPTFMPHFHIPLQSGSDHVLKLMRRRYDRDLFSERLGLIQEKIPDAFVGIDIIAGMRGELEEHHEETMRYLTGQPWSQLHVFPYSERQGTRALAITPVVGATDKKRRTQDLLTLSSERFNSFCSSFEGKSRPVLWEASQRGGRIYGFTDNYLRVSAPYNADCVGSISTIKLEKWSDELGIFLLTE